MDIDFGSAVLSALFVVLIVFSVLVLLWIALKVFSAIIVGLEKRAARRVAEAGNGGE
jgi:hypothetical protein